MSLQEVSCSKCFGGNQKVYSHRSEILGCTMKFSIYIPPQVEKEEKVPVLYLLGGIGSNEESFMTKSGFQRYAAEQRICVVGPDTGPRGEGVEDKECVNWTFGTGSAFYLDPSEPKWVKHYKLYSYVCNEIPALIESSFPFVMPNKRSICGYSMGGHGALVCCLKNPGKFLSCTLIAPSLNPSACPLAKYAFAKFLGENQEKWKEWDATFLVRSYSGPPLHILIDQGSDDQFLKENLLPNNFLQACSAAKVPVIYRMQQGYDHSYFFVATVMGDHINHHAKILH